MEEKKFQKPSKQELIEWAVGVIHQRGFPLFLIYNIDKEKAMDFASSMIEKAEEVRVKGGTLRNYRNEIYRTSSFQYSLAIKEFENGTSYYGLLDFVMKERAEGKNLVLIVLDPENKLNLKRMRERTGAIDLGYFINNLSQQD